VRLHVASFAQGKVRTFPLHYIRTITELRLGGVGCMLVEPTAGQQTLNGG